MIQFTIANGFILGNWKIESNNSNTILENGTKIKIDNNLIIVNDSNYDGELTGDYIITCNNMNINNVRISKIPPIMKLPKAMNNYKWIKLVQQNGISITMNDYNDTTLFLTYKCIPYIGNITLKKID